MSKGVLVDITKCVGCGSCTVACKMYNGLKYDDNAPNQGEAPKGDSNNWTTLSYHKVNKEGKEVWRFVKEQCLHCEEPACVSVCFSKAFIKTEEGPVVYNPKLCVGCRYCMIACPFEVPKYQWEKTLPLVTKCQMCASKVTKGEAPACVGVCPTNAIMFGEKDQLIAEARKTINSDSKYVNHIYGETEAGGTNWLYISDVPFEELGMRTNIPKVPIPSYTHNFLKWTPAIFLGGGALFTALNVYTKRRLDVQEQKNKKSS
ncbi:MAG: 4Fe-4S dicluster domain-containing protein [Peptococcales bacterium]